MAFPPCSITSGEWWAHQDFDPGPLIKSQPLYQLSYAPAHPSARAGAPIASAPGIAKGGA